MRSSISSNSNYRLKSVSLGTSKEFVRLYNELTESVRLCGQRMSFSTLPVLSWKALTEDIINIDNVITRAEKNAQLREVLAGVMLLIEQSIDTVFREMNGGYYRGVDECFNSSVLLMEQEWRLKDLCLLFTKSVASRLESAYEVMVSAILTFVYQYLMGSVGRGGSKTYSSGSFEFRDTFVAIVLFRGAYVWIKFRLAACPSSRRKRKSCETPDRSSQFGDESHFNEGEHEGVYRRPIKNKSGTCCTTTGYKYEPRFKPPRERLESGTTLKFNCLSLGQYNTRLEARIVRQIAAFLYGKGEGSVQLEDGHCFSIPSMSEQEKSLSGTEKAKWVTRKSKDIYADLLKQRARQLVQLQNTAVQTNSHFGDARRSDPSPTAEIDAFSDPGTCNTANELTCFPSSHGGNGAEQLTAPESKWSMVESISAAELFSDLFSSNDFEQFIAPGKENDVPATDDQGQVAGDYSGTACVCGFESSPVPPQPSAVDVLTTASVASLQQLDGGAQGLELIEPQLSPGTMITFQQMESVPGQVQVQQLVACQKNHLEEFVGRNVELQQKLSESEVQKSELQQKLRESEVQISELHQKLSESEVQKSELYQKLSESEIQKSELHQKLSESEVQKSELQRENERLKTVFQEVAKLISACNLDGNRF